MGNSLNENDLTMTKKITKSHIGSIIFKYKLQKNLIGLLENDEFENFILKLPYQAFEDEYDINKDEVMENIKNTDIEILFQKFCIELTNEKPFDENFAFNHYCLAHKLLMRKNLK